MNSAQGPGRGQPTSGGLTRNEAAERRANLPPATYKAAGAGAQHLQGAPVTYQYQQAPAGRGGPTTFQYQQRRRPQLLRMLLHYRQAMVEMLEKP